MTPASPFAPGTPAYARAADTQRKFQSWRKSKPLGNRRIPEELWECAARLAAVSTVCQVSRFLSLDFTELKKRVSLAFGNDCPALPKSYRKKIATIAEPLSSPKFHADSVGPKMQVVASPDCPGFADKENSLRDPSVGPIIPVFADSGSSSLAVNPTLPNDGFLEIPTTFSGQSSPCREILAEIQSPRGGVLRLFSCDTAPIIQAFLRS